MKKIAELTNLELKWLQPHVLKMEYCLRGGNDIAANLRFRSSFSSLATAESADGCWTFKRFGFFQTKVAIRACDSETILATFKSNAWSHGGTLEFTDGRKFLAKTNFWMTKYWFCTETGQELLTYHQIGGFFHASALLNLPPLAGQMPELPLLVLLGWYLIIMAHQDSAAAAAAA